MPVDSQAMKGMPAGFSLQDLEIYAYRHTPCLDCGYSFYTKPHLHILYLLVYPGSLTLREVRGALWSARDRWYIMGYVLGLPRQTLQVIEGHAVS